jgi:hypothetical protein
MLCFKIIGNSNVPFLPIPLRMIILRYLQEEKCFYLVDVGSIYGTYVKIKQYISTILNKGETFLIGADVNLNIVELWNQV